MNSEREEELTQLLIASEEHTQRWETWALEYQQALRNIYNMLGPQILDCPEQHCEGCRAEAYEALRITKEALGIQ